MSHKPYWARDVAKPYKFTGFGAMEVTKPYKFIGFGARDVTKPYKFIFWCNLHYLFEPGPLPGLPGPTVGPKGPKIDQKPRAGFISLSSLRSAQWPLKNRRLHRRGTHRPAPRRSGPTGPVAAADPASPRQPSGEYQAGAILTSGT